VVCCLCLSCVCQGSTSTSKPGVLLKNIGYLTAHVLGKAKDPVGSMIKRQVQRAFFFGNVSATTMMMSSDSSCCLSRNGFDRLQY